jgi:hypothetical protein
VFPPNIGRGTPGTVRVGDRGRVTLPRPRVACPAVAPACTVTLDARAVLARGRTSRIAKTTQTIAPGKRVRVHFDLSRSALVQLARKGRIMATVTITAVHATATRARKVRITIDAGRRRGS